MTSHLCSHVLWKHLRKKVICGRGLWAVQHLVSSEPTEVRSFSSRPLLRLRPRARLSRLYSATTDTPKGTPVPEAAKAMVPPEDPEAEVRPEEGELIDPKTRSEMEELEECIQRSQKKEDETEIMADDYDYHQQHPDFEKVMELPAKERLERVAQLDNYVLITGNRSRKEISMERNFITPVRAMTDFMLKPGDLQGIRKTMRRSPHADEPPITVYWRKDVEDRAIHVWGSLQKMYEERAQREQETYEYNEAVFNLKQIMKKYRRYSLLDPHSNPGHIWSGSGKIVLTAVAINGSNFVIKLVAWWLTGSHSLFAEAIHSLADTINQLILAYGIHKSTQRANIEHPYGYAHMRHVASLISGVGIFCVGAGLSIYHGITGLVSMEHIESLYWAFYILAGSLVSEGATLFLAVSAVRKRAAEINMSFREFMIRGQDPALNVVILEDTAAVLGVLIAGTCMGLTTYYGNPIPDAMGSLVIGGLLGVVASFIIYSNSAALVGRSIPREKLNRINLTLESDIMIRAIHDVKGIDMGNNRIRYKAEVDFDGRELTRAYMDKHDIKKIFSEAQQMTSTEQLETFILTHGEGIVDSLGAEIDRIENKLKKDHPEIRHCDLEIL